MRSLVPAFVLRYERRKRAVTTCRDHLHIRSIDLAAEHYRNTTRAMTSFLNVLREAELTRIERDDALRAFVDRLNGQMDVFAGLGEMFREDVMRQGRFVDDQELLGREMSEVGHLTPLARWYHLYDAQGQRALRDQVAVEARDILLRFDRELSERSTAISTDLRSHVLVSVAQVRFSFASETKFR